MHNSHLRDAAVSALCLIVLVALAAVVLNAWFTGFHL